MKRSRGIGRPEGSRRKTADLRGSFERAFETMQIGVTFTDLKGRIVYTNPAEAEMHGYSVEDLIGRDVRVFAPPALWNPLSARQIKTLKRWKRESINTRKDGSAFPVQLMSDVITDAGKRPIGIVTTCEDITARKQMEEKLLNLSITDELTGLYNRRGFFNLAGHLLKLANRSKSRLFLLYADVNDLKMINDAHGHNEGDAALSAVAAILKGSFRDSDIIARIGGDEFVVFPVGDSTSCVEVIAGRLKRAFDLFNRGSRRYRLSLSFGITYYDPEHPCPIDHLLGQADKAMYGQKRLKRV